MKFRIENRWLIGAVVALTCWSCVQTKEFQNNNYQKVDGKWYLVSDGDQKVPVVENTLTLKYAEGVTEEAIKSLESEHGLTLIRKAATGWCDYTLTAESDLFAKAKDQLSLICLPRQKPYRSLLR